MNLTEAEKKEILSKYDGTTSDELLNHLKRNFPVSEIKLDWMKKPIKQISIDYKTYNIEHNKKYLVVFIFVRYGIALGWQQYCNTTTISIPHLIFDRQYKIKIKDRCLKFNNCLTIIRKVLLNFLIFATPGLLG